MKPTLERSDQVVAHVVAWHNRHPLALRITPGQVHSVGVVSLPFAVRGARAMPVMVAEPAPAPASTPAPDPAPAATREADAAEPEAGTEVAIEAVVEFELDGSDAAPAAEQAADIPDSDSDSDAEPGLADAETRAEPAPVAVASVAPALPHRPAELPSRPRAWHPLTWWGRLRGRQPFHALFSEDFIEPLRPRQVRPWVARHGTGHRPLEPQAPQRLIMLDAARRRVGDEATEVDLHVITAAVGLDDGRHRLLLSPGGAVLGRRRWSRPRLVAAAGSAAAVLALVGGGWVWHGGAGGSAQMARQPAPAAPAASQAVVHNGPVHNGPVHNGPVHNGPPVPDTPASAPADAPSAPLGMSPRRGRIELPPLVPRLADADRQALRSSSRGLRRETAVRPDAKAWALVTVPLADRRQSERVAAQLHAVALLQPMPMRAELMAAGAGWRAVFWPFPSAQDAEKVRLALADKGLRTEVLEF